MSAWRLRWFLVGVVWLPALACGGSPSDEAPAGGGASSQAAGAGGSATGGAQSAAGMNAAQPSAMVHGPIPHGQRYARVPAAAGKLRIGDAGSVADPSRFDANYPQMAEWAKAGVEGGVPGQLPTLVTLTAADDLQARLTSLGPQPARGVVLLAQGTYRVTQGSGSALLHIPQNVVLRGESREETILSFSGGTASSAVELGEGSGLESVTIVNADVLAKGDAALIGKFENHDDLPKMGGVLLSGKNAWLQDTNVLYSSTQPVVVGAEHCTLRDNLIEKSYNKGGDGAGYYFVIAHHALVYNETIRDIRHYNVSATHHVVTFGVYLEVDVNYHASNPSAPLEHNLLEQTVIQLAPYHKLQGYFGINVWKGALEPNNLIWQVPSFADSMSSVFFIHWHGLGNEDGHPRFEQVGTPPPAHGTLYAVTGADLSNF